MARTIEITIPSSSLQVVLSVATCTVCVGFAVLFKAKRNKKDPQTGALWGNSGDDEHAITSVEQLRSIIPEGQSGSDFSNAKKKIDYIDDQMKTFLQHTNLCFVATQSTEHGHLQVSPKGDPPGFIHVASPNELWIPDRPGNRLLFGLQNLLVDPSVGLCCVIAGTDTTLRIGGTVRLSKDPAVCQQLQVRGCPATLVLKIKVDYAFFHCAKSFMRGKIWKPEAHKNVPITFGLYFGLPAAMGKKIVDPIVNKDYADTQKAIDGLQAEQGY